MLKNIKYIAVFSIVTLYVFQLCTLFSEVYVENVQQIRHQNQISKAYLSEYKVFSISEWNRMNDKKEIKLNDSFYDVVSFKIKSNKVVVNVVKDNFENEIRIALNRLFNKKNSTNSNKKKRINTFNHITVINKTDDDYLVKLSVLKVKRNNSHFIQGKPNKITLKTDRPPC